MQLRRLIVFHPYYGATRSQPIDLSAYCRKRTRKNTWKLFLSYETTQYQSLWDDFLFQPLLIHLQFPLWDFLFPSARRTANAHHTTTTTTAASSFPSPRTKKGPPSRAIVSKHRACLAAMTTSSSLSSTSAPSQAPQVLAHQCLHLLENPNPAPGTPIISLTIALCDECEIDARLAAAAENSDLNKTRPKALPEEEGREDDQDQGNTLANPFQQQSTDTELPTSSIPTTITIVPHAEIFASSPEDSTHPHRDPDSIRHQNLWDRHNRSKATYQAGEWSAGCRRKWENTSGWAIKSWAEWKPKKTKKAVVPTTTRVTRSTAKESSDE